MGRKGFRKIKFKGKIHSVKTQQSSPVQESSFSCCLNYLWLFLGIFLPYSSASKTFVKSWSPCIESSFPNTPPFQNTQELGGKFRNGSQKLALHKISCSSARFCGKGLWFFHPCFTQWDPNCAAGQ